jgi:hypothetical protein
MDNSQRRTFWLFFQRSFNWNINDVEQLTSVKRILSQDENGVQDNQNQYADGLIRNLTKKPQLNLKYFQILKSVQ